ncbi:MAG: hypothetical protein P4L81_00410 [Candidatus Pacebacteria bacterium]|nr:hypothetical protein [Candidatus Paceibacterota bacterium]
MLKTLSDNEIDDLIRELKAIPNGLLPLTKLIERNKHRRRDFEVASATESGNQFVIAVRQSMLNPLDFSAILGYKVPGSNAVFRLRRYNGSHFHTNQIEGTSLNDFHIHTATERYQTRGLREDAFAQVTSSHSSLETAIRALLEDCGFNPPALQASLFGSTGSQ